MKHPFQIRTRFLLLADLVLIGTAVVARFALRLDIGPAFVSYLPQAWLMIAVALLIKPAVFYFLGMYRRYWVYASVREIQVIAVATATASIFVALFVILLVPPVGLRGFPRPVACVHSDPEKLKKDIYGGRSAGRLDQLPTVVERNRADEVIIAIPTASGPTVRLGGEGAGRAGAATP